MKKRDFLKVSDLSPEEITELLTQASALKAETRSGKRATTLSGKTLAMIFEKPSSRTRVSFEVGMFQLGGQALNINASEIKMGERETIADVGRVLSRYVDVVMIRAKYHWTIVEFAKAATVPVINGLSDHHHPCQALADLLTVKEHFGTLSNLSMTYVGDPNNVCNSLIEICDALQVKLNIACPPGYEPLFRKERKAIKVFHDPVAAVKGANVVYSDVWISMGQEAATGRKLREFHNYAVTSKLMSHADPQGIFLHCLPAHRGQEVDDDVIEGANSLVFEQAENRMHAQKALLVKLLMQRPA